MATDAIHQIREGNRSIIGLMIESHLNEGNQSADLPLQDMAYGVSILMRALVGTPLNNYYVKLTKN